MLDVAIVGGGVCGLALAHSLQARGLNWTLFEARERLGGRVLTVAAENGAPLDLGATWYWPATQPAITQLVTDLGLASLAQPDDGRVWLLDDANRPPSARSFDPATGQAVDGLAPVPGSLHGGARRLVGGMQSLVDALARRLPAERLRRHCALQRVVDEGSHVTLQFGAEGQPAFLLQARRVVLALPPRLVAERIRFEPALPASLMDTLQATPTWMASASKAAVPCTKPVWRAQGLAGNAWVTHSQAVLAEVFDAGPGAASNDADEPAALAGFVALPAAQRPPFERSLPLLLHSQVAMLFGFELEPMGAHWHDWAQDPHTCSRQDLEEDGLAGHPGQGSPAQLAQLQAPLWDGRLWIGGSETARQSAGYLEGALRVAGRLRAELTAPVSG